MKIFSTSFVVYNHQEIAIALSMKKISLVSNKNPQMKVSNSSGLAIYQ